MKEDPPVGISGDDVVVVFRASPKQGGQDFGLGQSVVPGSLHGLLPKDAVDGQIFAQHVKRLLQELHALPQSAVDASVEDG